MSFMIKKNSCNLIRMKKTVIKNKGRPQFDGRMIEKIITIFRLLLMEWRSGLNGKELAN